MNFTETILSMLSPYLSATVALNALKGVNVPFKNFITSATSAGYGADAILGFLRKKAEAPGVLEEEERLESSPNLRPDEQSARTRLSREQMPAKAAGKILSTGVGLAAPSILSSLLPGEQERSGEEEGKKAEVMGKENVQEQQAEAAKPNQATFHAGFEKKYPMLTRFIDDSINNNMSLSQIAQAAKKKFKTTIQEIEEEAEMPFEKLLVTLIGGFGNEEMPQENEQRMQPSQNSDANSELIQGLKQIQEVIAAYKNRRK